jgi:hypothetical protein
MLVSTLRARLSSVKPRHLRSVRPVHVRLEVLESRDVPSTYYWIEGGENKWGTLTNWKLDSLEANAPNPTVLPGSGTT